MGRAFTLYSRPIVQSPICDVRFAGFTSDTVKLQQAGWQIAVNEEDYDLTIRMALKHEGASLYALTNAVRKDVIFGLKKPTDSRIYDGLVFDVVTMATDITMVGDGGRIRAEYGTFYPVDATPVMTNMSIEEVSISEFKIFRPIPVDPDVPDVYIREATMDEVVRYAKDREAAFDNGVKAGMRKGMQVDSEPRAVLRAIRW